MGDTIIDKIVPDTSVIIEGDVSQRLGSGELKIKELIIHEAVIAELEHQSNQGKSIGLIGLNELKIIRELSIKHNFNIRFTGKRPAPHEIRFSMLGEIDSSIRQLAWDESATLMTADKVQAKVAEAKGIPTIFIEKKKKVLPLMLEKYFDKTTMSVHLRENVTPIAKKGRPGEWKFTILDKKLLTTDDLKEISKEIIEEARSRADGFIEIEREGSTIVQLGKFRIVITKPPFSDGWEITAVRPVKKLALEDYTISDKLKERIAEKAEGILVAGAPGAGKTTFVQALAEFYAGKDKIVKTVEAPRDLDLPETITQYAISHGTPQEVHDILLLCRPDYTIFDEMRNTPDFKLFEDLRLAGVGMVGVVHATATIDAIQRFIGRAELGVIPHIIDTVVFIKAGQVHQVFSVKMLVKVPSGMTEADLARPIVTVTDFETGQEAYEIYTYGEQTVVIPIQNQKTQITGAKRLACESVEREFMKITDRVKAEMVDDHNCIIYVPEEHIARIIGKQGQNIEGMEKKLGLHIDVRELAPDAGGMGGSAGSSGNEQDVPYDIDITKKALIFYLEPSMHDKTVKIYIGEDFVLAAKASQKAAIKINKKNKLAKDLIDELNTSKDVHLKC